MKQEQGFLIADSIEDFKDCAVSYIEYWKENVKRVWVYRGTFFFYIFCEDKIAEQLQEQGETS